MLIHVSRFIGFFTRGHAKMFFPFYLFFSAIITCFTVEMLTLFGYQNVDFDLFVTLLCTIKNLDCKVEFQYENPSVWIFATNMRYVLRILMSYVSFSFVDLIIFLLVKAVRLSIPFYKQFFQVLV
jgi:hypothetical protein